MKNRYFSAMLFAALVSACFASPGDDVPQTNQPTQVLQRVIVPQTHYEVGMGIGEMAPNSVKSRRIQSGPEMVYVLEGELIYMAQGQPTITIEAGESFQVPADLPHETKAGPKGAKFLATWVVEQGKREQFVVPIRRNKKKMQ